MTLKEYIDKYSPFGFQMKNSLSGFLKKRPDVLADTISTLCMMNYKSVLSLEHKVRVKDSISTALKIGRKAKYIKTANFTPNFAIKWSRTLIER